LGHAFGIHHVLLPLWQHGAWSGLVGVGESQVSLVGGVGVIPGCVMVSNGKGGVLKTSLTANVAGLSAASGWRVLAVDLDPQGNLASDLGMLDASDGGEGLLRAVAEQAPLEPLRDVRPGLDLVAGGPRTAELTGH